MKTTFDVWLGRGVNLLALTVIAWALLRPTGPLGSELAARKAAREQTQALAELWTTIAGETDGHPTVIEFIDYQCPYCRRAEQVIAAASAQQDFRLIRRHLPLQSIHPRAEEAARVMICAESQGIAADVHRALLESEDWYTAAEIVTWLGRRGTVTRSDDLRDCLESPEVDQRLKNDLDLAVELHVGATPTFVSPVGVVEGLPTVDGLLNLASHGTSN